MGIAQYNAPVAPSDWNIAKALPAATFPIELCIAAAAEPAATPPVENPTAETPTAAPAVTVAPAVPATAPTFKAVLISSLTSF